MAGQEGRRPGIGALLRVSRRAFCLWCLGLPLVLAGCGVAKAGSHQASKPEGKPEATEGKGPQARPAATPTEKPRPSPTPTPPVATPTPRPTLLPELLARRSASDAGLPSPPRLPPERILIARVGVDAKIVRLDTKIDEHGDAVWETAAFAVGHHRGSANPGERGNIILSGHISSVREGAVFKRLPDVVAGDGVILMTAEQDYLYKVTKLAVVTPDHLEAVRPTPDETVTLITCVPDGVYSHRLVVTAKRVQPPRSPRHEAASG